MTCVMRHRVLRRLTPPFVFLLSGTSCPRQESSGLEGSGGPVGFEPVAEKAWRHFGDMRFGFGARHRRRQHHAGVVIPVPRACKETLSALGTLLCP